MRPAAAAAAVVVVLGLLIPPRLSQSAPADNSALPEVEWRLPVGCDFSGFFTEVVGGFLPFLLEEVMIAEAARNRSISVCRLPPHPW